MTTLSIWQNRNHWVSTGKLPNICFIYFPIYRGTCQQPEMFTCWQAMRLYCFRLGTEVCEMSQVTLSFSTSGSQMESFPLYKEKEAKTKFDDLCLKFFFRTPSTCQIWHISVTLVALWWATRRRRLSGSRRQLAFVCSAQQQGTGSQTRWRARGALRMSSALHSCGMAHMFLQGAHSHTQRFEILFLRFSWKLTECGNIF